jgi:hypothetical protein
MAAKAITNIFGGRFAAGMLVALLNPDRVRLEDQTRGSREIGG